MLVADTLTADLTFFENGVVRLRVGRARSACAASPRATRRATRSTAASRCSSSSRRSCAFVRGDAEAPIVVRSTTAASVVRYAEAVLESASAARRSRSRQGAGALMSVVVVALGKIGLPMAVQIARAGHDVVGCDIDERVVDARQRGLARRSPARPASTRRCARPCRRPAARADRHHRGGRRGAGPRARRAAAVRRRRRRGRTGGALDAVVPRRSAAGCGRAPTRRELRDDGAGRHDARAHRARARARERPARERGLLRRLQPRARLQRARVPRPRHATRSSSAA